MGPLAGLGRDLGIADPVELTDVHHIIISEVCRSETQKICERKEDEIFLNENHITSDVKDIDEIISNSQEIWSPENKSSGFT